MGPTWLELAGYAAGGAAGGLVYWAIRDSEALFTRLWAMLRTR